MIASLFLCAGTLALPAGGPPAQASTKVFAVRAARMTLADGSEIEGGVLLVEAGRIRAVGRGVEIPSGASVIEHDGFATAGMVACRGYSGAEGETGDPTRSALPEARIAAAFDPGHSDFRKACEAGITALVLAPSPENLAGGLTAVVKTHGGTVLREEAHLALSLSAQALWLNRNPTSASGAWLELEKRFKAPGSGPFALAAAGRLPVLIDAGSRDEIQRAARFAAEMHLRGALVGAPLAGELAEEIQRAELGVVVGPIKPGASARVLRSVVKLSQAKVPIAFALDAPWNHPESLRLSAALCVREGLEVTAAWRALTADAAAIAGVADRVGQLERGLDADFVLWSGPPLDLTSRVVAVYVGGERVHGGGRP